jgi:hypothetical protein
MFSFLHGAYTQSYRQIWEWHHSTVVRSCLVCSRVLGDLKLVGTLPLVISPPIQEHNIVHTCLISTVPSAYDPVYQIDHSFHDFDFTKAIYYFGIVPDPYRSSSHHKSKHKSTSNSVSSHHRESNGVETFLIHVIKYQEFYDRV